MADFSNFKVGSTSYKVKDAAAGKSLSISGTDLSLKNAAGTAISTVTLPGGGGGAYVVLRGSYNNMFNALVISSVVSDAGHTITDMQDLYDAVKNDGAAVYLVDETNSPTYQAEIIPLSYIYENALDPNAFDVGFVGVTKGWVSTRSPSDTLSGTPWVAYSAGSASPAPDAIIGSIAVDMTGQNITTSSFSAATGTILVDDMAKLRLSVKCPQGWPTDVGSLSPIACRVKTGNGGPIYDTIKDAINHSAAGNISSIVLYYEWKAGSWISVSINAAYNNGSLTITGGSAATASTLIQ